MRAQGRKVPPVLMVAVLVWACGGSADSAADGESARVIPSAEAAEPVPEDTATMAPAAPAPDEVAVPGDPAPPAPSPRATAARPAQGERVEPAEPAEPSGEPQVTDADHPVDSPPVEVVRTDPEPSRVPTHPLTVRPEPISVPVGTRISLTVQHELSTRTSRVGDRFDAVVDEDVLSGSGMVLLARGTPVRGQVVQSSESPGPDQPATLALAVERFELGDRLVPVSATVVELEHETEARDSDARTAAKVGAGAVAGAILGKIIGGDGKDALKGAVAGAAAGAAVAHATRDGHARVPEGAHMVIVLDEPLVVEQGSGGS